MKVLRRAANYVTEWEFVEQEMGEFVSDSEELVMFDRLEGENIVSRMFIGAQNSIKCEGREKITKVELKNRIIIYLREIFTGNCKLCSVIYRIIQF
jgi:hypothetical protein